MLSLSSFTNPLVSKVTSDSQTGSNELEQNLVENTAESVRKLKEIDSMIVSNDANGTSLESLQTIANNQKQVVQTQTMLVASSELAIAQSLMDGIGGYSIKVDTVQRWTIGSTAAFGAAVEEMLSSILAKPLEGIESENLFQLALLDALGNLEEYGLANDRDFITKSGAILEKIGSGSHTTWDYTPSGILDLIDDVWSKLSDNGLVPSSSVASRAMSALSGNNITNSVPTILSDQFSDSVYMDINRGGWIVDDLDDLSPMVRMVLLSEAIASQAMTFGQVDTVLSGSKQEVDAVMNAIAQKDAINYLWDECGAWQDNIPSNTAPSGITGSIDYDGTISVAYLNQLGARFPPRELTAEEVSEINNIGDQVKIIQQTLKYWIQLCVEEQLAIARNL
ncbi:hypothetical protein [Shewanella waksmanii]|uniref:hypothetical protein n=1 Tax=Shewanella waksmanii TaxID=213783 RepID=UPI003734FBB9